MPNSSRRSVSAAFVVALMVACPVLADTAGDMRILRERRIAQITRAARPGEVADLFAKMQPDGSYSDLNYASTSRSDDWGPKFQLERMSTLVGAYLADGPDHGDPKIKAAVLKGLDSWLAHDYQNSNWWWNKYGVQARLIPALLAFWDDLTVEQKAGAIKILSRTKITQPIESAGTNLVWFNMVIIDRGLLTGDAAMVQKAFADIVGDIHLAPRQADGAQPDNSYLYHGSLIYTLGYGLSYLRDQANLAVMAAGTEFAYPEPKLSMIRDWTLDGPQWMTRGRASDVSGVGRSIVRRDTQDAKILAGVGRDLLAANAGRASELLDMIARAGAEPGAKPLVGNRQFWRADFMTHHRPGWYASARLYSARTRNTEFGNGENLQGFYAADGTNLLIRTGQEYDHIAAFWDWQHLPGTTVELLPNFGPVAGKPDGANDGFVPNRKEIQRKGTETFVGGVSDEMYGVFGGKFSRDALSFRRGWFFFDDQYVCLGSGLTCASGNPVVTTLDDRKLGGPVVVAGDAGPTTYASGPDDHAVPAARWLLHDGVGYAFLTPAAVRFHNGPRAGDWRDVNLTYPSNRETADVFDAWVEHGATLQDAAFAYAVYPNTDDKALASAVGASPVTVASNTPDCQAVWHAGLGRGGAIFYVAGQVELRAGLTLAVDQPCMALLSTSDGKVRVTLSNPENKPGTVAVTVTKDGKTTKVDVKLPEGGQAGASVTSEL